MVEGNGRATAMLESDELLIVQGKELQLCKACLFQRSTADDDEAGNLWESLEHPLFVVVEYQCLYSFLFNVGLQRQGIKCIEDEAWILQVDIECVVVLLLEEVENKGRFTGASGTMQIDITLFRQYCFAQNVVVVARGVAVKMFEQIHQDTP